MAMTTNYLRKLKNIIIFTVCLFMLIPCIAQKDSVSLCIKDSTINYSFPLVKFKTFGIYENNEGIFLYAKQSYSDTLYLFKEKKEKFYLYKTSTLPQEYIDTVGNEIESNDFQIAFIDLKNIVIVAGRSIAWIDIDRRKLMKYYYQTWDKHALTDRFGALKWNESREKLPMMLVRFDDKNERKWDWDTKLLAEFDIHTGKIEIFPIVYPFVEQYRTKYLNFSYIDPLITFNRGKYVVGFGNNPIIFTYDTKSRVIDSLYVKNKYYKPISIINDTNIESDFSLYQDYVISAYTSDFFYTSIVYDKYNHTYYRFFFKDMPKYDENGLLNSFSDKKIGINVLDENFNIIGDVVWDSKGNYSTYWYPTSKGIYGINTGCVGDACKRNNLTVIKLNLYYEK